MNLMRRQLQIYQPDSEWWIISHKWAQKRIMCSSEGIKTICGGRCCTGVNEWRILWPNNLQGSTQCKLLKEDGCALSLNDRPVGCLLFPFMLNKHNKLILYRYALFKRSGCCYGHGDMVIKELRPQFEALFGIKIVNFIIDSVEKNIDPIIKIPNSIIQARKREKEWRRLGLPPEPRSHWQD